MRLVELVDELVDAAHGVDEINPRVVVRWYLEGGGFAEREVEMLFPQRATGVVLLHVPRPAQPAGELGAGDVVDESAVPELDVDLVLDFATGRRGCGCADHGCKVPDAGKAFSTVHRECRERLKLEQMERIREGERCRSIPGKS